MRILAVSLGDFTFPTERQYLGFVSPLLGLGHQVRMVVAGDPTTHASEGFPELEGLQVGGYRFAGPRLDAASMGAVNDYAPDLVHCLNPRGMAVVAALQMKRAGASALAVHFEDDEWGPLVDPGRPASMAKEYAKLALSPLLPRYWYRSTPWWLRKAARMADGLDALTPALANEVATRLGRECTVIPPANPGEFSGIASPGRMRPTSRMFALYTGRVVPEWVADLRIALSGVALARERGLDIEFVQTGAIDAEVDLAGLLAEAGLDADHARFLGHLPFTQVEEFMTSAAVLIQAGHPNRVNSLRLPSKLQSYLASGTPVVTFAVGFGEMLRDRHEVLKVHTGDPSELADRLVELLTGDDDLWTSLSRNGPAAAERLFDPVANAALLAGHYERTLDAFRAGRK